MPDKKKSAPRVEPVTRAGILIHQIAPGYYGIETQDWPADPKVVEYYQKLYREAAEHQMQMFRAYRERVLPKPTAKKQSVIPCA